MKKLFISVLIISLSLGLSLFIFAESLWNDKAGLIYTRKVFYNVGDTVEIVINEQSSIDYRASSKSLKSYNLNITGGELTGILSFVPKGDVEETKNSQNKDSLRINNKLQGRITAVTDNYVTVTGSKRIIVDNKNSIVRITGDANLSDISGNKIDSNMLVNPVFSVTTLIDSDKRVINDADLIKQVLKPDQTSDIMDQTKLSEEKKRELLLNYFNKVLNVLF